MALNIDRIETLLLIAAVVAIVARRLRVPYTVGLVLAGMALAFSRVARGAALTKEVVFTLFLPPLIFEAANYISWAQLRRELPLVLTLAVPGVLAAVGLTAVGMHYAVGWPWISALLFGSLIAATDPISVIALFKEMRIHGRLRLLVESESLLNDGTAAVVFSILLAAHAGQQLRGYGVLLEFIQMVLGGILCGGIVAGVLLLLAGRTEDHLVEITFTTVAAYGSFIIAERFHTSGVLAVLTAGLLTGNLGPLGPISEKGREAVASFWEYVAFAVNSLVFLLIGMREARIDFGGVMAPALGVVFVTVTRALVVYGCCAVFSGSQLSVPRDYQHVLFFGGLRGALALALALGLPSDIPHREGIITVAFAVVAFSIIVQGLSMRPFLRKVGVI